MNEAIKINRPGMSRVLHERLLAILLAHQDVRDTCQMTQRAIEFHQAALEQMNQTAALKQTNDEDEP